MPGAADLSTDPDFFALLTESHERLVGRRLVPPGRDAAWLYGQAPFAVLAHDAAADPRFIYANRTAQARFEYDRAELIGLPSRLSAEAPDRAGRQALLDAVAREGFATGYRGLRVAKSGRRFWIEDGVVWQLVDRAGIVRGQAASFSAWRDA
ncbi:MEKHLA domain-containing protein [Methylobacterium nigriterrae]|uniref:MEKHLA domain-containing protein n=1 Tax=Methylobacterium nigriterrae TaxID=3127512 RepID=UPI0030135BED